MEYTKIVKKSGIKIAAAFIFGFDSDNLKTFFDIWRFSFSIMPVFSHVAMLTPLPGTRLYQQMLAQDRIINLNWRSHDYNRLVVHHPHLNHTLLSFFFPLMRIFFLITTSNCGLILLAVLLLPLQYWLGGSHFLKVFGE